MSFDLGLMAFKDGEPGTLSSSLVLQVLKPFVQPIVDDRFQDVRWELVFPDGSGGNMMEIVEGEDGNGFVINRPHGTQIFDALYEIMRQTHTLMWWAGMDNMITADETIGDHLESDYIEKYGVPPLVRSGADILAEIAKT